MRDRDTLIEQGDCSHPAVTLIEHSVNLFTPLFYLFILFIIALQHTYKIHTV